ncbi:MAG: F0F1 ATP synthase subunit delta [Epsilonproteobacteria bacterium]|jgi:F-type H+-transporting ATPase subunit delta|nr:F0F1 ATP synthase subunit delta [Campylobacterota bacterium]
MSIKKYVKALIQTTTKEHLEEIYNQLAAITQVAKDDKYKLIISSPLISGDKKVEFLVESLGIKDQKAVNLLKLLAANKRLSQLPELLSLLKDAIADITGNYKGYVYSHEALAESKIAEIEDKLSKKFNKNITLEQKLTDRSGVQVYVDSLNVEIALYEEDIKNRLIQNIIRAI